MNLEIEQSSLRRKGNREATTNYRDLLRHKNLLLSNWRELSDGKSLVDSIPTEGEPRGDPVAMAASETDAAMQIRLHQTDASSYAPLRMP